MKSSASRATHQAEQPGKQARPVWLMSSGGKDSIAALIRLQQSDQYIVAGLVTTFNPANRRVALHGTPLGLIEQQAALLQLPLHSIGIPHDCSNKDYERLVAEGLNGLQSSDRMLAFGDLFLDDIRAYREQHCAAMGWQPVFPIWGLPTLPFSLQLMDQGVRAIICCVDLQVLDASILGREWNPSMLADLPQGVDPAGENGEFHTLVIDAPNMKAPLDWHAGHRQVVSHDRYCMLDLQPGAA